ncbi:MAG: hypothetical protein AAB495_00935 [Patescibacteria group bacterium]
MKKMGFSDGGVCADGVKFCKFRGTVNYRSGIKEKAIGDAPAGVAIKMS